MRYAQHRSKPKCLPHTTDTVEGSIPHLAIPFGSKVIHAPVCVEVISRRGNVSDLIPQRRAGKLIYALPGGGRVTA